MDMLEGLRTNPAIRDFTDESVSDAEVWNLLDVARFAPSGGNRQPWHVVVVKDAGLRRQLADLCGPVWSEYMSISVTGATPFASTAPTHPAGELGGSVHHRRSLRWPRLRPLISHGDRAVASGR
jgi:nitroreductase